MVSPGEDALPWKYPVPWQVNKPQGHTLMLNLVKHQFRFTLNRTYINLRLKSVKFINQVKCKILKTTKNNNNNNNKEQKKEKKKMLCSQIEKVNFPTRTSWKVDSHLIVLRDSIFSLLLEHFFYHPENIIF